MRVSLATILLLLLWGPVLAQSDGPAAKSPNKSPRKKVTPRPPLTAAVPPQAAAAAVRSPASHVVRVTTATPPRQQGRL